MNVEVRYAQIKDPHGNAQRIYFLAVPTAHNGGRMRSLTPEEYRRLLALSIKGWQKSWIRRLWFRVPFGRKAEGGDK